MMEDLLDTEKLCLVLESIGFTNLVMSSDTIICDTKICNQAMKFKCVIPEIFPFDFPAVYIDEESYATIKPLPHVGSDNFICTFDKSSVIPDFKKPAQVIQASLTKARDIIRQGILKENYKDFLKEFQDYWRLECVLQAESICVPSNHPKNIVTYYSEKTGKVYLADSKEELDLYLCNIGIRKRYLKDYCDGLYLPLRTEFCPPFPQNNYDMYRAIRSDKVIAQVYDDFLRSHLPGKAFVSFSISNSDQKCMQLFMHTRIKCPSNGFRKGRMPANVGFSRDTNKEPPIKFLVEDMRQERLFTRGGVGVMEAVKKVAIIGCGSVGSLIAAAIAECGISSFLFVDNDRLSAANIARHYCGHNYIEKNKAAALSDKLCQHNPNISAEVYDENGLKFIKDHLLELNSCDLIIVATASTTLEYRIVSTMCDGLITKPVVLTWVEPLMAAGHALLLNKAQPIFDEFFDAEYTFTGRVLENAGEFQKQEFGCQSTYIPYGAFELKRFIYEMLSYLLANNISKGKVGNYWFAWCGDLIGVQKAGGVLAQQWKGTSSYSNHIKRID